MKNWLKTIVYSSLAIGLTACGGKPPTPPEAAKTAAEAPAPAAMPRMASPAGATVSITSPANGEKVKSPVTVKFAIEGMTLAPAGSTEANTGHHHLLVDAALPDVMGQPIVKDDRHLHFGKGQTEAQIELPPGQHTLQLLLGDGNHVPHDPPVFSGQILITVE